MRQKRISLAILAALAAAATWLGQPPAIGDAGIGVVYGVFTHLNMGNENEKPLRDYYISVGTDHGVKEGAVLKVWRKVSTHDVQGKKLYRDVTFPIAKMKVIHAEEGVSVGRIEEMLPIESTPGATPQTVIAGDLVSRI